MIHTVRADVILRPWAAEDAPSLASLADNINIYQNTSRLPYPYTIDDAKRFLTTVSENVDFCIQYQGKPAGACGLTIQDSLRRHSAEAGFWLGEAFWNQGVLSAALPALTQYGFEKLHLSRIYGVVFCRNKASAAVFRKSGFREAGFMERYTHKDGELLECFLFEKIN